MQFHSKCDNDELAIDQVELYASKTILDQFDLSNNISKASGTHLIASLAKDQTAILKQLMDVKVFDFIASRTHKSFDKSITVPVTNALEKDNLRKWMIDRLKKYSYVN